jgi:LysM repeat protein
MKRFALLLILVALLAACDDAPDQPLPTPLPPAPTTAADNGQPTTPTEPTTAATATESALATVEACVVEPPLGWVLYSVRQSDSLAALAENANVTMETVMAINCLSSDALTESQQIWVPSTVASPTDAPTAAPTLTEAPSPEASATSGATPTDLPTVEPTTVSLFAPGQQDGGTLATGGAKAYLVDGRGYQPIILFVEPTNELNVALSAYVGDQTGQTTPEGITPPAAADNALAGRPEILVLSPESDGLYTLVVRAVAGEGSFAAHLYDLITPAPGIAVQQPDTLAAGEEKTYTVSSRGARPVIAVADPTDQSDIALDVLGADGTLLTTANYSGPGGVETAYVLPLGATSYTVKVREANGGPAMFQILVITVE